MAKGVQLVKSADEAEKAAASLLGKTLVTYQTGAEGQAISKVLVTVGHDIARELYLGLAIDRALQVPGADGLDRGGRRDRDGRRTKTPEKIHREPIDVGLGLADFQARKVCKALGLTGETAKKGEVFLKNFVQAVPRQGRLARRDQPADRHRGGRRAGARLQDQLRRQRPVPPPRPRRACSTWPRKTRPSCGPARAA